MKPEIWIFLTWCSQLETHQPCIQSDLLYTSNKEITSQLYPGGNILFLRDLPERKTFSSQWIELDTRECFCLNSCFLHFQDRSLPTPPSVERGPSLWVSILFEHGDVYSLENGLNLHRSRLMFIVRVRKWTPTYLENRHRRSRCRHRSSQSTKTPGQGATSRFDAHGGSKTMSNDTFVQWEAGS